MTNSISMVILAAGKGTRLKMNVAKPLAPVQDKVLLDFVLNSAKNFGDIYLITGHQSKSVETHVEKFWKNTKINFLLQEKQLGTGHAIQTYFEKNLKAMDYTYTLVMCADTPLITSELLEELCSEIKNDFDAVCATFIEQNPTGYGRILRGDKGFRIVEEKDATAQERLIEEVNSGLYIFKTSYLKEHIYSLDSNNKAGEFYLTDTFTKEANVKALKFEDKDLFIGVNNLYQLASVEKKLTNRTIKYLLLEKGVRVIDPSHTYIFSKNIEEGTVIYPNVHIDSHTKIGKNVTIEPGCILKNSIIEDNVYLKAYTYITDSLVKKSAKIGPMSQLRPGTEIGEGSKLGNFVEVKKSIIKNNVSVSHLSYVGDAEIGDDVNIGCGFITCNYDGQNKHKTIIGDGSFIGSDCQMIAPVEIGHKAYIGSGSTINKNVPDGAFAIARERQVTKENMAKKFLKKK